MDPEVIKTKLESLSRCIRRIESRRPSSAEALSIDLDAQDIVTLNIERAVQLCVDAGSHVLLDYNTASPESMAGVFLALGENGILDSALAARLSKAAGFRNIAVHEYASIDWNIVYTIITTRLDDFRCFASALLNNIKG